MPRIVALWAFLSVAALSAFARETPSSVSFSVGAGSMTAPRFSGSDEFVSYPLPLIDLSYRTGPFRCFIGVFDGAGTELAFGPSGPYAKVFAGPGFFRLVDAPQGEDAVAENWITGNVEVGWRASSGWFLGVTGSYVPVRVCWQGGGHETYDGRTLTVAAGKRSFVFKRLLLTEALGLQLMDREFAEALFSVRDESKRRDFSAEAGLSSVTLSGSAVFLYDRALAFSAFGGVTRLLADAASSPVSESDWGAQFGFAAIYRFF